MKTVMLQVNDEAEKVVVGVLTHLEHLSVKDQTRTIRIGGDEKVYDGTKCEIQDIEVDGQIISGYDPASSKRHSKVGSTTVGVAPISTPNLPPSVSAVSQVTQQATQQATQGVDMKELEEKVDVILSDLCNGEGLFTAYDITKEIRNDGTRCRHADVRRIVHDTYRSGEMPDEYTRSLIFVDGSHQAFVYHPDDVDPNVYTGDDNATADADTDGDTGSGSVDPLDALDD